MNQQLGAGSYINCMNSPQYYEAEWSKHWFRPSRKTVGLSGIIFKYQPYVGNCSTKSWKTVELSDVKSTPQHHVENCSTKPKEAMGL